jgi:hypothetical protein
MKAAPRSGWRRLRVSVAVTVLVASPALAQSPQDLLREIARCSETPDAAARLRCFDAAAERVKPLLEAPAAAPAATATPSPAEAFGLSRPAAPVTRPEQFGKPPPRPEELQSLTATATEFAKTARGKALFVLDNGQVWRQLDSDGTEVANPPARAFKVTIERGSLGSYNLTMEGRNSLIKVTRIR